MLTEKVHCEKCEIKDLRRKKVEKDEQNTNFTNCHNCHEKEIEGYAHDINRRASFRVREGAGNHGTRRARGKLKN
jgi:cytochrome c553